jgi:hypothetical protein
MGAGDEWTSSLVVTRGKLNQMTIVSGLASYINGLTKSKNRVYLPEDSGGGLTAYNLYAYDGAAMKNLSNPVHGHSSDLDGGQQAYQAYLNTKLVDTIAFRHLGIAKVANYLVQNDGAGTTTTDDTTTGPDSIKHNVAAVLNGRSYIKIDAEKVDFTQQAMLACLVKINTLTNLVWSMGINTEWTGDTNDTIRKLLFEYCTSVNTHIFVAAADGTTRTSTDTGITLDANDHHYKFLYTPAVKMDWQIDTTVGIKTTNVPTSGSGTDTTKGFVEGIKTTNSALSTANCYSPRVIYKAVDTIY